MQSVVGVTHTVEDARRIGREVVAAVPRARVRVLTPDTSAAELASVPTDESEQPGMGAAIGAVAGGAAGAVAGSMLLPPVGAIALIGIATAALLGAVGGGSAGQAIEESAAFGLPKEELFLYADALRDGHAVVIAYVETDDEVTDARRAMDEAGAESVDAAREAWWIGLRDAEAAEYGDVARFHADEPAYRRGFERACRGEPPPAAADDAERTGYTRGRAYVEARRREIELTRPAIVDERHDSP
jgi:hypothetical protein